MNIKITLTALVAVLVMGFTSCTKDDETPNVKACFSYLPAADAEEGDTVYFTNCSTEALTYEWNFGDGSSSTEAEPFHVYETEGQFNVTLIAINGGTMDSVSQTIAIAQEPILAQYIINYGSYSGAKGTIAKFDPINAVINNNYFESVNGVPLLSNIQYAYHYNGNVYFMGNNVDEVSYVDATTFKQSAAGISSGIIKPRHCVAEGNTLYVSCWGGDVWTDISLSYIAKIDLSTMAVASTIALAGGPEGLEIANGKLYAALNYMDSVAVIDLGTDAIDYIATPAVSTYFVKDNNENLYVSLISSYSMPSDVTGLGYINTSSDKLEATYQLTGISSSYVNIMAADKEFTKLYVMTSAYDAEWNLTGAIATFDVASKAFDSNMFIEGVSALNGVGVDQNNDDVYCFVSDAVTASGIVKAYQPDGTFIKDYTTGIAPARLLTIE